MGKWIDIPAHRVWVLPRSEFYGGYELLGEGGERVAPGFPFRLARRTTDGRLFRAAPEFGEAVAVGALGNEQIVLVET